MSTYISTISITIKFTKKDTNDLSIYAFNPMSRIALAIVRCHKKLTESCKLNSLAK